MSDRPDTPTVLPAPLPEEQANGGGPERRTQARFPFTASAEVYDVLSQTRVNGRCSDLSERGCYVDTLSPLTVGAVVKVRIVRNQREFEAEAVVAYAQIPMGMGLAFTGLKGEDQETLRSWIGELSGEQPRELAATLATPTIVPGVGANEKMATIQPVIYGLINLLIRKKIITETEAAGLLRQLFL